MDHNELDPSVEAFIRKAESSWQRPASFVDVSFQGGIGYAYCSGAPGWMKLVMGRGGGSQEINIHCGAGERGYHISHGLAAAINTVLAKHAEDEKPEYERVRDVVVDSEMPF